jgi:hypothetical protein
MVVDIMEVLKMENGMGRYIIIEFNLGENGLG